eukprot:scaffold41470_cov34-Phaeocystis_antarctica.AAC.3
MLGQGVADCGGSSMCASTGGAPGARTAAAAAYASTGGGAASARSAAAAAFGWFHGWYARNGHKTIDCPQRDLGDRVAAARLEYTNGTMLGRTHATSGCAANQLARSGGRALKQERVPELRFGDVSVVRARGCWSTCAYAMASSSPT